MKRIPLAAAAAFLALGTAHAQQRMPWYGELAWTHLKIDAGGTSARPDALRALVGYDVHPLFAVEGFLAGGINDDSKNTAINGVPAEVTVKLKNMYGLLLKPKYNYNNQFEVFGRLGWAHTKVSVESVTPGISNSDSTNSFAWGLGGNFHFNPAMYVGVDWMRYANQGGHQVDGLSLSFGYHW